MSFIKKIKENNQFPIIFIGSGITQRYFEDAPTWEGVLKSLWLELFDEEDFYAKLFELKQTYENDFDIYLHMADYLEKEIDNAFTEKRLDIANLTLREAYEQKVSPFKRLLANKFLSLKRREGLETEILEFSRMLSKARIIITTNYDTFIEDCLQSINTGIKVNVGNKGLFSKSVDYGELFKIHGSVKESNSIAITSKDYEDNREKSSLVNAKILSNLVEAPILFLGYSLTDENIRKLLVDFAKNSPYDIKESSERIGVVEYTPNQIEIEEVISSLSDLAVHYTQIKTDNFVEIYKTISQIEQGISPLELSKFERTFRRIIEIKGEDRELKTVLTTYLDISNLTDEEIRNKNIVVAFGDEHYIYKYPDMNDYLKDYFSSKQRIPKEVVIGFIAQQPPYSYFPFRKFLSSLRKYVSENSNVAISEKVQKLLEKELEFSYSRFKKELSSRVSKVHFDNFSNCKTIEEVISLETIPLQQRYLYIASHFEKFNHEELNDFIINLIESQQSMTTDMRKLLKMYDYYVG